jgi:hypothetical protein
MIFQYECARVFRRTSILIYIACLSTRLWHINVHKVSINHRLTHIHCLLKMPRLLFSVTLTRSIILLGYSSPPPLHYRRGLNGFLWYLHSFRRIYRMILGLRDTFIISECGWQIIYNILQIYYFLNLKFNLLGALSHIRYSGDVL